MKTIVPSKLKPQVEGSTMEGGRGQSVWDVIVERDNGRTIKDADKYFSKIEHYKRYKATQGGEIGLVKTIENYLPYSYSQEDVNAAKRLMDFFTGWILDPVIYGDYPNSMKELVKDRLPVFTEKEKTLVQGSTDFIGINYYRSFFARNEPNISAIVGLDNFDALATREGISSGVIKNPLKDKHRIYYIAAHLNNTKYAIETNGVTSDQGTRQIEIRINSKIKQATDERSLLSTTQESSDEALKAEG
ncbi:hypothetical protein Fmac_011196 [Flemingia macrophylla]|uniref:Beta-glucosidase n=1 Tax=Flemingia macrophylla TaxID=520843 RepID=A0ABD1MLR1_9FABA